MQKQVRQAIRLRSQNDYGQRSVFDTLLFGKAFIHGNEHVEAPGHRIKERPVSGCSNREKSRRALLPLFLDPTERRSGKEFLWPRFYSLFGVKNCPTNGGKLNLLSYRSLSSRSCRTKNRRIASHSCIKNLPWGSCPLAGPRSPSCCTRPPAARSELNS
jgi:hypothetical protein